MPSHRLWREVKWLLLGFGVPFLLLVVFDLVTHKSPLPLGRRLVTLEDTCSYGSCIILAALVYVVARMVGLVVEKFGGWRVGHTESVVAALVASATTEGNEEVRRKLKLPSRSASSSCGSLQANYFIFTIPAATFFPLFLLNWIVYLLRYAFGVAKILE